jgi:Arc/MetJ-type ribon-helix-helix transcriptional regulator
MSQTVWKSFRITEEERNLLKAVKERGGYADESAVLRDALHQLARKLKIGACAI